VRRGWAGAGRGGEEWKRLFHVTDWLISGALWGRKIGEVETFSCSTA
jgi:hypothetical protein